VRPSRSQLYTCLEKHGNSLVEVEYNAGEGGFRVVRVYEGNDDKLIQMTVSQDEKSVIGTFMFGYKVSEIKCCLIGIIINKY